MRYHQPSRFMLRLEINKVGTFFAGTAKRREWRPKRSWPEDSGAGLKASGYTERNGRDSRRLEVSRFGTQMVQKAAHCFGVARFVACVPGTNCGAWLLLHYACRLSMGLVSTFLLWRGRRFGCRGAIGHTLIVCQHHTGFPKAFFREAVISCRRFH